MKTPYWIAVGSMFVVLSASGFGAGSQPVWSRHGMVVAQEPLAVAVGVGILRAGGGAIDAAVATAFALAVTHPAGGNIGGGGFIVYRPSLGEPISYDFREVAPAAAHEKMFLADGAYDPGRHHNGHRAVGVPGTVAGLYLAWQDHGRLPWRRIVEPAIELAQDGFALSHELARSFASVLPRMQRYPASVSVFSNGGVPYETGDLFRQADLGQTLERIATDGPIGFYAGETARLIEREMEANGGLINRSDLANYAAERRDPILGTYRGYEIVTMPPISSGGTALVEMLNILEGFDLRASGHGSALNVHRMVEAMRRAYADRARYLGDPAFNPVMPIARLTSKAYGNMQRRTINPNRASVSTPETFRWPTEGSETTHLSVVDVDRNAVSLTFTLEQSYGSKIVVPGGGFLLNNEMGDFNAGPGLTTASGLIGTEPNLAAPSKRMLSSMTPTILAREGRLAMVTGSPGGRTIINTVLHTILNVVDFQMNIQEAVDAPRFHHEWLPDVVTYERHGLSPDTVALLETRGHSLTTLGRQGTAQAIFYDSDNDLLAGAADRRWAGSSAAGY